MKLQNLNNSFKNKEKKTMFNNKKIPKKNLTSNTSNSTIKKRPKKLEHITISSIRKEFNKLIEEIYNRPKNSDNR